MPEFELRINFILKLVVKTAGRREVIFIIFGAPSCVWLLSLYIPGEQIEESTAQGLAYGATLICIKPTERSIKMQRIQQRMMTRVA